MMNFKFFVLLNLNIWSHTFTNKDCFTRKVYKQALGCTCIIIQLKCFLISLVSHLIYVLFRKALISKFCIFSAFLFLLISHLIQVGQRTYSINSTHWHSLKIFMQKSTVYLRNYFMCNWKNALCNCWI